MDLPGVRLMGKDWASKGTGGATFSFPQDTTGNYFGDKLIRVCSLTASNCPRTSQDKILAASSSPWAHESGREQLEGASGVLSTARGHCQVNMPPLHCFEGSWRSLDPEEALKPSVPKPAHQRWPCKQEVFKTLWQSQRVETCWVYLLGKKDGAPLVTNGGLLIQCRCTESLGGDGQGGIWESSTKEQLREEKESLGQGIQPELAGSWYILSPC